MGERIEVIKGRDLEGQAVWSHPENKSHQKKWLEAVNFLRTKSGRKWRCDDPIRTHVMS